VHPRRLVLVRHALAGDAATDRDRPQTRRGELHAGTVGARLARAGLLPDRVLVSPARRAVQTWQLARAVLDGAPEPVLDERIYDNTVEDLVGIVREMSVDVRTIAVVGHNPSIGELAAGVGDEEGDPELQRRLERGFPTGGVAVFVLAVPFGALEPGAATLTGFVVPGA